MNKTDRMAVIMREMLKTYRDKNADYGDSFAKSYDEFGLVAPVVRMNDKMERIKALSKADAKVKDESIKDTLLDLANYAIMTVVEIECDEDKSHLSRPYDYLFDMYCDEHEDYIEGDKLNIL